MKGLRNLKSQLSITKLYNSKKFSLDDTIFIYTIYLALTVSAFSFFINLFLNLPISIHIMNACFCVGILFIFWLSYYKRKFTTSRILLHIAVLTCINFLWFETDGSSGPSTVFIMGFIPLLIFFSPRKTQFLVLSIVGLDLLTLFILENAMPGSIVKYPTDSQRSMDIMFMTIIFLIFEIPLLQFAKQAMLSERNQALVSEERKTSMIANLSHEIRTPMNAILGFTELMSLPDLSKDEHQKYLNVISQNGKILLNLLNNIINQSKIETNMVVPSISRFSVKNCMEQVYHTLLPSAQSKSDLDFIMEDAPKPESVIESDHTLIYQILINLTYNAIKFTNKGKVVMSYTSDQNKIIFKVSDTGIGIAEHLKPLIFKQFRKGDADEEHLPMQGAGLGLSICKGLTEILKGEIQYQSNENEGTEFTVSIPSAWPA